MSQKKFVYITILNWNGADDTIECLNSLEEDHYPNRKTLVIDNASTDDSVEKIRRAFPGVEIIKNEKNEGFARGFNLGIKKCLERGADYILPLSNDVNISGDFLEPLVQRFLSDKKIGIVSPKILSPDGTINALGVHIDYRRGHFPAIGRGTENKAIKPQELEAMAGSCFLVSKELFNKIGLIPEDYFFYFEETDLCLRTRRAGYKIYLEPKSVVCHKGGASSNPEVSSFSRYYFTRNNLIMMKKFAPKKHWKRFMLSNSLFISKKIISSTAGIVFKGDAPRRLSWTKAYFWGYIDFWRGKKGQAKYPWLTVK